MRRRRQALSHSHAELATAGSLCVAVSVVGTYQVPGTATGGYGYGYGYILGKGVAKVNIAWNCRSTKAAVPGRFAFLLFPRACAASARSARPLSTSPVSLAWRLP